MAKTNQKIRGHKKLKGRAPIALSWGWLDAITW